MVSTPVTRATYLKCHNSREHTLTCFVERTFCTTGIAYAAVFPEPVRARARMSLPCIAKGIVFSCIGNGLCQPSLAIAYTQQLENRRLSDWYRKRTDTGCIVSHRI